MSARPGLHGSGAVRVHGLREHRVALGHPGARLATRQGLLVWPSPLSLTHSLSLALSLSHTHSLSLSLSLSLSHPSRSLAGPRDVRAPRGFLTPRQEIATFLLLFLVYYSTFLLHFLYHSTAFPLILLYLGSRNLPFYSFSSHITTSGAVRVHGLREHRVAF